MIGQRSIWMPAAHFLVILSICSGSYGLYGLDSNLLASQIRLRNHRVVEYSANVQELKMAAQELGHKYEGSLLWTLEEISHLVSHSGNAAETLKNVVQLIQQRFKTDVCSVYLLEPDRSNLVLAATIGLLPQSVGRVR